jgi:hypothetical protein
MNAFREHHEDSIRDRLLLNGLIQPFPQPERVVRFLTRYRDQYLVTRQTPARHRQPVPRLDRTTGPRAAHRTQHSHLVPRSSERGRIPFGPHNA